MNGTEVKQRAKTVFENEKSTQHEKLDILYLLMLYNSDGIVELADEVNHNPLYWVPPEHRKKVVSLVGMWALLVSAASIERIISWLGSLFPELF